MRFIADTVTSVLLTCQRLFSPHRCYSLKPLPKGDWGRRVLWGRRAARSAQPYSQHPPTLCSTALKPWAGTSTRIRSTRIPRLSHFSTARRSPRPRISLTNLLPTPKRRRRPSACGASPGPPLLSPNPGRRRPPPQRRGRSGPGLVRRLPATPRSAEPPSGAVCRQPGPAEPPRPPHSPRSSHYGGSPVRGANPLSLSRPRSPPRPTRPGPAPMRAGKTSPAGGGAPR